MVFNIYCREVENRSSDKIKIAMTIFQRNLINHLLQINLVAGIIKKINQISNNNNNTHQVDMFTIHSIKKYLHISNKMRMKDITMPIILILKACLKST